MSPTLSTPTAPSTTTASIPPIPKSLRSALHHSSTPEYSQLTSLAHTYLTEYANITPHVNLSPTDIDNLTDVIRHIICC